jgi:hypothetical protein
LIYQNITIQKGQWRRGKKEGYGKEITRIGYEYESIYLNGTPIEKLPPDLSDFISENLHCIVLFFLNSQKKDNQMERICICICFV